MPHGVLARKKLHPLAGGGTEIGIRNAIQLIDISEGGLGLDMVEDDARHVHVDDLLAIRLERAAHACWAWWSANRVCRSHPPPSSVSRYFPRRLSSSRWTGVDEATNMGSRPKAS
ncbi:MAG: hypothetical protein IPP88_15550 [Betaproteobacteria bacterium]|nr:hypothetical protein [Betaproteobacteria bacterium]